MRAAFHSQLFLECFSAQLPVAVEDVVGDIDDHASERSDTFLYRSWAVSESQWDPSGRERQCHSVEQLASSYPDWPFSQHENEAECGRCPCVYPQRCFRREGNSARLNPSTILFSLTRVRKERELDGFFWRMSTVWTREKRVMSHDKLEKGKAMIDDIPPTHSLLVSPRNHLSAQDPPCPVCGVSAKELQTRALTLANSEMKSLLFH